MINGHGDDIYQYNGIKSDFSSNICQNPAASQAVMDYLSRRPELLMHYPEPEAWSLEQMIAEREGIKPENVIVTSGATEAIYLVAQTFRYNPVIPQPTFSEYADACRMFPASAEIVDLSSGVKKIKNICWLCNPNNPTGEVYDQLDIDRMMAEYDLAVLDHSYEHYTQGHVMSSRWGCRIPYSVQIHSMTKTYAMPGLRLGYITAHENLTKQIRQYLRPWSVSSLAVEAGKYLLQHDELICKPDYDEVQRLQQHLEQIWGVVVKPTQTNFMLCQLKQGTAHDLKDYLAREHGMLIRDCSNFDGLTPQHFRIAAQTPAENDALVEAIRQFMKLA